MRLKRWESPRREGRNDKGRGGSARQRQLKKQQQMLRKRLKEGNNSNNNKDKKQREDNLIFPLFFLRGNRKHRRSVAQTRLQKFSVQRCLTPEFLSPCPYVSTLK